MATLADALRQFGAAYLRGHTLSTAQAKAWRANSCLSYRCAGRSAIGV